MKKEMLSVHVKYFENSKSGSDTSGIKAKGTLHWVEQGNAVNAEVRQYERLFVTKPLMDIRIKILQSS